MDGLARVWDIREAALKRYGAIIGDRSDYALPLTTEEKNDGKAGKRPKGRPKKNPSSVENETKDDGPVETVPTEQVERTNGDQVVGENNKEGQAQVADPAGNVALPTGQQAQVPPPEVPIHVADPATRVALPLGPGNTVAQPTENDGNDHGRNNGRTSGNEGNPTNVPVAGGAGAEGAPPVPPAQHQRQNGVLINPGAFVFNDEIDRGVKLVAKLQHGELPSRDSGIGTRGRNKLVKVICVARSPRGGEFATGSDDGFCRVWKDEDDWRIRKIDERSDPSIKSAKRKRPTTGNKDKPSSQLLATLPGHSSSITDLHYSHRGDRILTASQKDGKARIWTWNGKTHTKQIVLSLSSWTKLGSSPVGSRRARRQATASQLGSSITCDVAVWMCDDSKIITSQSCPAKATSQEIVPGSQLILVWDSTTGQCLLGIPNAHEMQCPVVVPHPKDPTVMCSAGADSTAKVWDLEQGRCFFSHTNKIIDSPVSPSNERSRKSGYLDGSFDPDGLFLILTDDNGRVSVFDCFKTGASASRHAEPAGVADEDSSAPTWMREQYFGNDYYELYYNTNGYCVERGSEQPPHLAPRAVRCSHSGAPWSDEISDTFRYLKGPFPLPEHDVTEHRLAVRRAAQSVVLKSGGRTSQRPIVSRCDPANVTILGTDEIQTTGVAGDVAIRPAVPIAPLPGPVSVVTGGRRTMSANYRWRDWDDLIREENILNIDAGAEPDPDDEEFVPRPLNSGGGDTASNTAGRNNRDNDDDDDLSSTYDSTENDELDTGILSPVSNPSEAARARRGRHRRRTQNAEAAATDVIARARPLPSQPLLNRTRSRSTGRQQRASNRRASARTTPRRSSSTAQPTPPSRRSRRSRSRARPQRVADDFDRSNSSGEGFQEEFLSTNTTPSGEYVDDYEVDDHIFRVKQGEEGSLKRRWVRRKESTSSYNGRKIYSPQAGDTVIYVPRSHWEVIKVFPTLKVPWKAWPGLSSWPVVRCQILDVRYRFPYGQYFQRRTEG